MTAGAANLSRAPNPWLMLFLAGAAVLPSGAGGAQQLERGGPALQGVLHGQRQRPRRRREGRARKGKTEVRDLVREKERV